MKRVSLLLSGVCLLLVGEWTHDARAESPDEMERRKALQSLMETNRRAFPGVPEVDAAALIKLVSEKKVVLVDVRTKKEQAVSMIPGAITAAEFEKNPNLYKNKTIVSYCTVGYRSAKYAQQMNRKGVAMRSFNGSVIGWCQSNQPLTGADGKETRRVHTYGPKWNLLPPEYEAVW
ncbi:rhodanese-like domain-containing protein [bacterium]|nr:rhodanese-like domain-containing protein [bacterium]